MQSVSENNAELGKLYIQL